jgi:hypothetical protein
LVEETGVIGINHRPPPKTNTNIHIKLYRIQLTIRQNLTHKCGVDSLTIHCFLFWSVYRFVHKYIISIFVNHTMTWILLNSSDPLFSALCVLWGNKDYVSINCLQQLFIYRLIIPLFIYILKWVWFLNTNIKQKVVIAAYLEWEQDVNEDISFQINHSSLNFVLYFL